MIPIIFTFGSKLQ